MAILLEKVTGREVRLEARSLVGRSPAASVLMSDRSVSGEHAVIQWTAKAWALRDLGSRNGTWINGRATQAGAAVAIGEGDVAAFGSQENRWVLINADPPTASARRIGHGEIRGAEDGILVLPDPHRALVVIYEDQEGRWMLDEREGELREVKNLEVLNVDGEAWILQSPAGAVPTLRLHAANVDLGGLTIYFRVSRDEEHVDVVVEHGQWRRSLPGRRYHYMLLTLARERIRDGQHPDIEEDDQGWMHAEDLCRMLETDDNRLNVDIYRMRKELAAMGIQGAGGIIERRRTSRQLRLGVTQLEVQSGAD